MIPFTISEFLEVFERYNNAVWPAQLVLYGLASLAIGLLFKNSKACSKTIAIILAVLWLWMGIVYHFLFFSRINGAAFLFGALFISQSIIFAADIFKDTFCFRFRRDLHGLVGAILVAYAMFGYPFVSMAAGHNYPSAPTFGVPCPTTIFTFGIIIAARPKVPPHILAIPLIWSVFGFWAALSLGMIEDFGLVIAGLTSIVMIGGHHFHFPGSYLRDSN